jgi:hypothetical protein
MVKTADGADVPILESLSQKKKQKQNKKKRFWRCRLFMNPFLIEKKTTFDGTDEVMSLLFREKEKNLF